MKFAATQPITVQLNLAPPGVEMLPGLQASPITGAHPGFPSQYTPLPPQSSARPITSNAAQHAAAMAAKFGLSNSGGQTRGADFGYQSALVPHVSQHHPFAQNIDARLHQANLLHQVGAMLVPANAVQHGPGGIAYVQQNAGAIVPGGSNRTYDASAPIIATSMQNRPEFVTTVGAAPAGQYIVSGLTESKDNKVSPRSKRKSELFSAFQLNNEGSDFGANYLPYKEMKFPALDRGPPPGGIGGAIGPASAAAAPAPSGAAEVDALWLMGFLDHENNTQKKHHVKDFAEYETMFRTHGPDCDDLHRETKDDHSAAGAANGAEGKAAGAGKYGGAEDRGKGGKHSFLSGAEIARLRELQHKFLAETQSKGPTAADRLAESAYVKENTNIRRVLALRSDAGQRKLKRLFKPLPKSLKSTAMDNLLYLERLEAQAAVVIQRALRKYLKILFWKKYLHSAKQALSIQRAWRGYKARGDAKVYKKQRETLALKLQANARGTLVRKRMKSEREWEREAAEDIQRLWRGFYFRVKARKRLRKKAAIKIQRLWRGLKGRARADRLYLDTCAGIVQRNVRMWLVRKRFRFNKKMESDGAAKIQAVFRGWLVRRKRNTLLFDRDGDARKQWMAILKAEEVWLDKELLALGKFRNKADIDGQIKTLEAEWVQVQNTISEKEFDLVSLQTERIKLSPRAVEQGWSAQLDRDVAQHREWVTEHKTTALFRVARPLRDLRSKREKLDLRVSDMIEDRRRMNEQWVHNRAELWRRENELKWGRQKYDLAKKTADEKRKWAVKYFTEAGKVDMARRPGQPLLLEDFPHAESKQLTIAHGNIMALTRPEIDPDPGAAEKAGRDARLRLEATMQQRLAEATMRFGAAGVGWAQRDEMGNTIGMIDGQQVLMLADGTIAMGPGYEIGNAGGAAISDVSATGYFAGAGAAGGHAGAGMQQFSGSGMHGAGGAAAAAAGFPTLPNIPGFGPAAGAADDPIVRVGYSPAFASAASLPSPALFMGGASRPAAAHHPAPSSMMAGAQPSMALHHQQQLQQHAPPTGLQSPLSNAAGGAATAWQPATALSPAASGPTNGRPQSAGSSAAQSQASKMDQLSAQMTVSGASAAPQYIGFAGSDEVLSVRPDLSAAANKDAYGTGKTVAGVFGIVPDGARGKVVTVGRYFGDEYGFGISGDKDAQHKSVLRSRAHADKKTKPLHERVWETSISRYAGIGVTVADPHAKNRPRTDVAEHVMAARAGYAAEAEAGFSAEERGGMGIGIEAEVAGLQGNGVVGSGMSTSRASEFSAGAGFSPRSESSYDGTKSPTAGQLKRALDDAVGPYNGIDGSTVRPRVVPGYVHMLKDKAAEQAASEIPDEMRNAQTALARRQQEVEMLARLAPGLAGARAGAAAAAIAMARAKGTIGHTNVRSTAVDMAETRKEEQKSMDIQSLRIGQLAGQISAVSAQAELMQYGALAKPLMDGISTLAQHLLSADGTAVTVQHSERDKQQKAAERTARLEAARAAVKEAKMKSEDGTVPAARRPSSKRAANKPHWRSGGGDDDGPGDGSDRPDGKPPRHPSKQQQQRGTSDALTETYVAPNAGLDNTQLSLMHTLRPTQAQRIMQNISEVNHGTALPRTGAAAGDTSASLSGALSAEDMIILGPEAAARMDIAIATSKPTINADPAKAAKEAALNRSIQKLKATQSRVRAQMAVAEANQAVQRGIAAGGGGGSRATSDIWSEETPRDTARSIAAAAGASSAANPGSGSGAHSTPAYVPGLVMNAGAAGTRADGDSGSGRPPYGSTATLTASSSARFSVGTGTGRFSTESASGYAGRPPGWSLADELRAEKDKLIAEQTKPLPFPSAGHGTGSGSRGVKKTGSSSRITGPNQQLPSIHR